MPLPAIFYALGSVVIRLGAKGAAKAAKDLVKRGFKKLTNPTKTQQNNAVSIQSAAAKKILKGPPGKTSGLTPGQLKLGKIAAGLTGGAATVKVGADIAREMRKDKKSDSAKKSIDGQSGDSRSAPRKDLGDKEPSSRKDSSSKDNKPAAPKKNTTPKKRTKISDSGGREDAKEKNKTRKLKPLEKGRRRFGDLVVDSTDKGMQTDDDEMRRNKGGAIKKTYGMRAGGFTKRGGMYKKGY
tara:strand:- start:238 stop:957 length:720 start_codon:yes stop_codon:yes gene_type:complete